MAPFGKSKPLKPFQIYRIRGTAAPGSEKELELERCPRQVWNITQFDGIGLALDRRHTSVKKNSISRTLLEHWRKDGRSKMRCVLDAFSSLSEGWR
jgi:hypothetical protein